MQDEGSQKQDGGSHKQDGGSQNSDGGSQKQDGNSQKSSSFLPIASLISFGKLAQLLESVSGVGGNEVAIRQNIDDQEGWLAQRFRIPWQLVLLLLLQLICICRLLWQIYQMRSAPLPEVDDDGALDIIYLSPHGRRAHLSKGCDTLSHLKDHEVKEYAICATCQKERRTACKND